MMKPMHTPYDFHLDKKTRFLPKVLQPLSAEEMIEAISVIAASIASNTGQSLDRMMRSSTVGVAGKYYPCSQAIDMLRSREISIGYRMDVGTGNAEIANVGLRNDDGKWRYATVDGI